MATDAKPTHVDLHFYGSAPDELVNHVATWLSETPGLRPCVFEWNLPERVAIQGTGAYKAMIHALSDAGVEVATYFCARNAMVEGLGFFDYPWIVEQVFQGVQETLPTEVAFA